MRLLFSCLAIFVLILNHVTSVKWTNFRQFFNPSELYFVVETVAYSTEVFRAINLMNKIAIIWVTYDHEVDPYLKLYIEYVLELTKHLDSVNVIIRNSDNDPNLLPQLIEIIPEKSVFIIVEDADLRVNLCSLYSTLQLFSRESPIIFHLNHETPWTETMMGVSATGYYCSSYALENIYRKYRHVFRNYYSNLYQTSSDYVPLLSKQGRRLQQFREENILLKSSQRGNWCIFSGRIKYDHMRAMDSVFHAERHHFIDLLQNNSGTEKDCRAYYNNNGVDGHQHTFSEYMDLISQTVFTPCPSGNSPETFRHYEAMELGSIPIFIRPPPEADFLTKWVDYPGPIFSNWEDALKFISTSNPSDVDILQVQIMTWYENYRENISLHFSSTIKEKFGISRNSPTQTIHVNDIFKTNASPSAALQLLQTSQKLHQSQQENKKFEENIQFLIKEVQELTKQQQVMLNLLTQIVNHSVVSSSIII